MPFNTNIDVWTTANLVYWLDHNLQQIDIPHTQMLFWLRDVVEYLTCARKISLANLMIAKYVLLNKLSAKITLARKSARAKSFELFERESRKELDFNKGFEFKKGMYTDVLYYQGNYKFAKHFLDNVPAFDGAENGEEFLCAQSLDAEANARYWIRNVARKSSSFWLPTSTYRFYPDFIAKLNDDRILALEYKGSHISDTEDTKEKSFIGEVWEKLSKGTCLFLLGVKDKNGKTISEQIYEKVRS